MLDNNLRNILNKFTTDIMNDDKHLKRMFKSELKYANKLLNEDNPVPSLDKLKKILENNYDYTADERITLAYKYLKSLENGVETDNEQPKYELEIIDINATDNPLRVRVKNTHSYKTYGVESIAWNLLSNNHHNQTVLHYVYTNFDCEIS